MINCTRTPRFCASSSTAGSGRPGGEPLGGDTGETQVTWSYPGTFVEGNQSISAPIIADLVGDGQARVGFYHDVNLNGTNFFVVLKSNNVPWQPAPTHLNQRAYWETNFVVDATHNNTVPFTYARQSGDPRTNVFGVQPHVPVLESHLDHVPVPV